MSQIVCVCFVKTIKERHGRIQMKVLLEYRNSYIIFKFLCKV